MPQNTAFTSTPSNPNPAAVQAIYPEWLLNPVGSQYAAEMGYADTRLLAPVIQSVIVDSIPDQYRILQLLFDKTPKDENDDEITWFERGIPRPALTILTNTGGATSMTIPLTAGGSSSVSINTAIVMPDGRSAIVESVNTTANTVDIKAQNGQPALAAVVAGEKLIVGYTPMADGQNFFSDYTRLQVSPYTNWCATGLRAKRWTRKTALRYQNNNTTDYFTKDAQEMMENVYNDMFYLFMDAHKGEFDITVPAGTSLTAGTYKAKVGDGIYPFLVNNGAAHSTSSAATFEADFKTLAFNTNYKAINQPRFILGTPQTLNYMSDIWKDPIRYTASDTVNSMDLMSYEFGGMRYIPIPIVHFEERFNQFQSDWASRLLILDLDAISTWKMKGYEQVTARNTSKLALENGGDRDYIDYTVEYSLGVKVETVQGHFYMDIL